MWSYSEINLKFAFRLYLCKIPNESPTVFFTPSFPGFRIFSLKVLNALKGIVILGYLQAFNSQSQELSSFIPAWGSLCFPRWTPGSQFSGRWLFKIKKAWNPAQIFPDETQHPRPQTGEARWSVTGNSAPLSSQLSSSLWCCLRQPLSGWVQPGSLPGLQLEKLKGAPAHEGSCDQRKPLQPLSSPSCFWPHSPPASLSSAVAFTEGSFPRWCHSNRHNTCPLAAGLINGSQPEQAPRMKCVQHPQVLCFSEVWPPRQALSHCIRAFYVSLGRVEAVFASDTSTDVVLGGTFVLEEAKRKTQAICL